MAIDNAIIAYEHSLHGIDDAPSYIDMEYQGFPKTLNRYFHHYSVVSTQGPLYFFIPPMILFGMIVSEIAKEK